MTPFKLLLVPADQIDPDPDGRHARIVTMDTGWRRLVGPSEIIADIPEDRSLCMSRKLWESVKVVEDPEPRAPVLHT